MNIDKTVINCLVDLGYTVSPDWVVEDEKCYFTFTHEQIPDVFADDAALTEVTYLTVHFFCPTDYNYQRIVPKVKRRLQKAGFSWPQSMSWRDPDARIKNNNLHRYRHVVFECVRADVIPPENEE